MTRIGEGKLSMHSIFISSKLRNYGGGNFGPLVSFEVFFFSVCIFKTFQFSFFPFESYASGTPEHNECGLCLETVIEYLVNRLLSPVPVLSFHYELPNTRNLLLGKLFLSTCLGVALIDF